MAGPVLETLTSWALDGKCERRHCLEAEVAGARTFPLVVVLGGRDLGI